jgi:hypothetical protein
MKSLVLSSSKLSRTTIFLKELWTVNERVVGSEARS